MRKGRDRAQRRSRFDDDDAYVGPDQERPRQPFQQAPRANTAPPGPAVDATVKWFNPEKGFGFVELGDGTGDAFLHVAVLEAAGRKSVVAGAKVKARVGQGQKGPQVTEVVDVDESTAAAQPARRPGPLGARPQRSAPDLS